MYTKYQGVCSVLYRQDPRRVAVETVEGFTLAKVWDEDPAAATCLSEVFDDKPAICATPDQVSDDVDLMFIADCNGDGSDHLALATPGLEKGSAYLCRQATRL